jgi:hypothetical protein
MVQINDASEIRRLVKANDSFNNVNEINDTFPKNHSLFQFYINVEGNNHLNGFYSFDSLLCALGKISEREYIEKHDEWENIQQKIENHTSLKSILVKEIERSEAKTEVEFLLNEEIFELEEKEIELRCAYINWEDQETLLENICINLRKCVYWLFFNENQQKQYNNGFLFIPKISNQTISLLDDIFNQTDQMETITNNQINKHLTDYETVSELCEEYMKQRTELGETIELIEATEEDESDSESESDEESVWETTSIDENENPDSNEEEETKPNGCYVGSIWVPDECPKCGYKPEKCDCTSYETDSEEEDEPEKMDECKKCGEYSYLIQQLKEKDHKITILNEIIAFQDKKIEEDEENDSDDIELKEEQKWEDEYYELEEEHEKLLQQLKTEKAEHNKTILDYAERCNILIDEVRELRKLKKETTDNI